jgi:soluble lytic murein transglycosylase-like protein
MEVDIDKLFCMNSKKYGIERIWLKAIAVVESSLNPNAYRFEQGYWDRYLKNDPKWNTRDPKEVSASYGLMQLMYTVAWAMGFRGAGKDLFNPVYNIELGARLLGELLKGIKTTKNKRLLPIQIALARYNGGYKGNPGDDGTLRNQSYVDKVQAAYWTLRETEKICEDT